MPKTFVFSRKNVAPTDDLLPIERIELGQVVLLYVSHELPGDVFWETGGPCQILSLSGYGIHRRAKGYGVFARGFFESNIHSSLQRFSVPSSYALKTVTLTCPVIIPRIFMDPMDKDSHNRKVNYALIGDVDGLN